MTDQDPTVPAPAAGGPAAEDGGAPAENVEAGEVAESDGLDVPDDVSDGNDVPDDGPDELDAPDEFGRLLAERDEFIDHLRRLQADFDNFRKRMLREQTAHGERATQGLVEQLLPVLDNFEMALAAGAGGPTDPDRLLKGVELVYANLLGVLEKTGLERIEAEGKPFDPEEHEAVMEVEDDGSGPGVRSVVRAGYRLKGRVLRPAMVQVAQ